MECVKKKKFLKKNYKKININKLVAKRFELLHLTISEYSYLVRKANSNYLNRTP